MRKRWLSLAAVAVATVLLASLFAALRGGSASAAHKASFSACLVTDIGGLNDKSFNHLAYVGLQHAERAGIKGRVIQSKSPADYIPNLKACVQSGAGITIGVGFLMTDAMDALAASYPEQQVRDRRRRRDVAEAQAEERRGPAVQGAGGRVPRRLRRGHVGEGPQRQGIGSVGGLKIPPVDRYIAGFQSAPRRPTRASRR